MTLKKLHRPYAFNRVDYVYNLVSPQKNFHVLNIGVSNIPEMEMKFESRIQKCVTIDNDVEKIEKARHHTSKTTYVIGDITTYDFKEKFDAIIMLEVLEHIKDDRAVLQRLYRFLKPGGILIIAVPNTHPFHIINPVKYTQHYRHYSTRHLCALLTETGFVIEHVNTVESWTLLVNLYIHLLYKFILRKNIPFGTFKRSAALSYAAPNKRGLDLIVRAVKP